MKTKLLLATSLVLLPILLVACGGTSSDSKSTPDSAEATYRAARDDADKTPVSDSLRGYVQQLCAPVKAFFEDASDTLARLDEQATSEATAVGFEEAFDAFLALFGDLEGPFQALRDDLEDVDPPDDLQQYHDAFVDQLDYALDTIADLAEDGFGALFALPTEGPTPEEPAGFEAGLLQECGEDLKDIFEEFGDDFFGGGDFLGGDNNEATGTPPPPGRIGETVRSGSFELTVNSLSNPYVSGDQFYQPTPGQLWVLFDVSVKNVSDETQDYGSFDFTLRDADDFSYDTAYLGQERDLSSGSLRPDEAIRGEVGFELPVDALPERLVFDPGFFGESRIDVNLR